MAFTFTGGDKTSRKLDPDRRAIVSQQILNISINGLIETLGASEAAGETVLKSLQLAKLARRDTEQFIREHANSLVYPEYSESGRRALAQRVFNVLELLELILSFLDIASLLGARSVSQQFKGAIDNSTKLQRRLSLIPHSSPFFHAPFATGHYPRFDFDPRATFLQDGKKYKKAEKKRMITVHAKFDFQLPHIGSKCRRMLMVHPPVQQVTASTNCCRYRTTEKVFVAIVNRAGVTIGDPLEAATWLKFTHRNCYNAAVEHHDPITGEVKVMVITTFQARVHLREDDPTLVAKNAAAKAKKERKESKWAEEDMLEAFAMAKRQAHHAFEPCPVFAEWREGYLFESSDSEDDDVW